MDKIDLFVSANASLLQETLDECYFLQKLLHSTSLFQHEHAQLSFGIVRANTISDHLLTHFVAEHAYLSGRESIRRRREFLEGRLAAKRAFAKLGIQESASIGVGANREPVFPEDWIGSITHSSDWRVSVVAKMNDYRGIGVDIEDTTGNIPETMYGSIFGAEELAWIRQIQATQQIRALSIFSLKESVYKALFPICRVYVDFLDVTILPTTIQTRFRVHLNNKNIARKIPTNTLMGHSIEYRNFIFSWFGIPNATQFP